MVLSLGLVAIPTLLRQVGDEFIGGTAFVTYYPFVLLAALLIGWRWATVVAVSAAMVANYLFMEPRFVFFAQVQDTGGVVAFLFSCGLIIFAVDTLRRTVVEVEAGKAREAQLNAELQHLNSELQHRGKNTFSLVQALATHTFRTVPAADEAIRKFQGRLKALAEAQSVLSSCEAETYELPDLAYRALVPFNEGGSIRISGPRCSIPQQSYMPLVLALHELGTNALKYGALSTPEGLVQLDWTVSPAEGQHGSTELVLDWKESGGPTVQQPTRRGLGSKLIAPQPGMAAATMDFRAEGLEVRLVIKNAALIQQERAPGKPASDTIGVQGNAPNHLLQAGPEPRPA